MKKIKNFLERQQFWILAITGLGIFADIFIFRQTWGLVILFLTVLWVLTVWLYKFEGGVSVASALVFLVMCPFLLIFKKEVIAEKAAIWAYMFLVVGVVKMFIESLKEKDKDVKK